MSEFFKNRIIEVNNNISPTEGKLELSNTIEISDHSYSTPYASKHSDTITASNINLKNKTECFNSNTLHAKNPQGENAVNIFDDIQNIGKLHCCIKMYLFIHLFAIASVFQIRFKV